MPQFRNAGFVRSHLGCFSSLIFANRIQLPTGIVKAAKRGSCSCVCQTESLVLFACFDALMASQACFSSGCRGGHWHGLRDGWVTPLVSNSSYRLSWPQHNLSSAEIQVTGLPQGDHLRLTLTSYQPLSGASVWMEGSEWNLASAGQTYFDGSESTPGAALGPGSDSITVLIRGSGNDTEVCFRASLLDSTILSGPWLVVKGQAVVPVTEIPTACATLLLPVKCRIAITGCLCPLAAGNAAPSGRNREGAVPKTVVEFEPVAWRGTAGKRDGRENSSGMVCAPGRVS